MVHAQEQRWRTTAQCLVDHLAPGGVSPGNPTSKTQEIPTLLYLLIPGEWQVAGGGQPQKIPGRDGKTLGGFRNHSCPTGQQVSHQYGEQSRQSGYFPHPPQAVQGGGHSHSESEIEKTLNAKVFMENQMQSLGKLG